MSVREDQSEGLFHRCSFRVLVEVGENILAEMLCSADLINDAKPVFSSSSYRDAISDSWCRRQSLLQEELG